MNFKEEFTQTLDELKKIGQRVVDECTKEMDTCFGGEVKKRKLLLPSGDMKYNSFWVRDCAMMAQSGFIAPSLMWSYIKIIACFGQNGDTAIPLQHGLLVPPWAVADHINYNGRPVYFPGTMSDGKDQGCGKFGFSPPHGDPYYFILLVGKYIEITGDYAALSQDMNGHTLLERLEHAWESYSIDKETGLCYSSQDSYVVDWGFCDTVRKEGLLLYPSILRCNAAKILSSFYQHLTIDEDKTDFYGKQAADIAANIEHIFWDHESGMLLSATQVCRQPDVWGTAYAVDSGLLTKTVHASCCRALAETYLAGGTVIHGYVRHLRKCDDALPGRQAWQKMGSDARYDTYQNGGWWATPSGWYFVALAQYDPQLCLQMMQEFTAHTRNHWADGAPYEYATMDFSMVDGKKYGTSGALPYLGALKAQKLLFDSETNR